MFDKNEDYVDAMRGLFAAIFIGAAVIAAGLHRQIHIIIDKLVIWRGLGEVGGTFFYLIALFNMTIANATIIFQAVPLSATAGAALFLGEKVGWRRWIAIALGFVGVVLVIRPGLDGFDAFGLLVLGIVRELGAFLRQVGPLDVDL